MSFAIDFSLKGELTSALQSRSAAEPYFERARLDTEWHIFGEETAWDIEKFCARGRIVFQERFGFVPERYIKGTRQYSRLARNLVDGRTQETMRCYRDFWETVKERGWA